MNPTPKQPYVLTFPQDEKGQDVKFRFMLTLSKQLKHNFPGTPGDTVEARLIKALGTLDGIDAIGVGNSRYTIEVTIARTYDADEVIAELEQRLKEDVLTELVRPKLVVPA